MAFRTVVIKNKCKLEYSLNYLVCRGDTETKILMDEIQVIVIQSTLVSLTVSLLSMCAEKKIKVIFCDGKANPQSELVPYYNNYCSYKKISQQIAFNNDLKEALWKEIIKQKIYNEKRLLEKYNKPGVDKLEQYLLEVEDGDITNREGHAAKVYFNSLFGIDFSRGDLNNPINKYLNYGYSIIVSCINREIKMQGYLTELGIHHIGETNSFNLSYDFFEPLRSYIDSFVAKGEVNDDNFKSFFVNVLSNQVYVGGKLTYLDNAIHIYVLSLFNSLNNGVIDDIKFIDYEL